MAGAGGIGRIWDRKLIYGWGRELIDGRGLYAHIKAVVAFSLFLFYIQFVIARAAVACLKRSVDMHKSALGFLYLLKKLLTLNPSGNDKKSGVVCFCFES